MEMTVLYLQGSLISLQWFLSFEYSLSVVIVEVKITILQYIFTLYGKLLKDLPLSHV